MWVYGSQFFNVNQVVFDNAPATIVSVSPSAISVVAPQYKAGTADVRVITVNYISKKVSGDQYTYVGPPMVTSIAPILGWVGGGTRVTVTGANFLNVLAVTFDGVSGSALTVTSPTSLAVTAPSHSEGVVDVQVVGVYGTSSRITADHYTYVGPPTVTFIGPIDGATIGGTRVSVTGTNFVGVGAVVFRGANRDAFGSNLSVTSPTTLLVTTPVYTAGDVDVLVQTQFGLSSPVTADRFTYLPPASPTVTSVTPNSGTTRGGTQVMVTGTNFMDVSAVSFGGRPGTNVALVSPTRLSVTAPSHPAGVFPVQVTTPFGTSPPVNGALYAYVPPPAVTSIAPSAGWTGGGTKVTVTGSSFINVTSVRFGGVPSTAILSVTPTSLVAIAPSHAAGVVDVQVTTMYGISSAITTDRYTYGSLNITFTDYSISGSDYTDVTGVNNVGVIVGYYGDGTGQHGFIDDHGSIVIVDPIDSYNTTVNSINDAGAVVGSYWSNADNMEHGYLRNAAGTFTWLDDASAVSVIPGYVWGTVPSHINNAGVVVGHYYTEDPVGFDYPWGLGPSTLDHGFVWSSANGFTTYDAPGAGSDATGEPNMGTRLFGLNNSGAMVGNETYRNPDNTGHTPSFVASVPGSGNVFTSIVDPQVPINWCGETQTRAINDVGTIVGESSNGCAPAYFAWMWRDNQFGFFNYPGALITVPSSITTDGVIAGTWTSPAGQVHGFMAHAN